MGRENMSVKDFNETKKLAEARILKRGYIRCKQRVNRYLYPDPKKEINKKKLTEITKALKKVVDNGEECSKHLKFTELSKSNDSKIMNNFDKNIFKPFWNKYIRYLNHLYLEIPWVNSSEIRGRTFIDDNDTAQWFNLEYVKHYEDLRLWWAFIFQWKRLLTVYKYAPRCPPEIKKIFKGINKLIISTTNKIGKKTIKQMIPTVNERIAEYIADISKKRPYADIARTFSGYTVSYDVVRRVRSNHKRRCKKAK